MPTGKINPLPWLLDAHSLLLLRLQTAHSEARTLASVRSWWDLL